MVEFHHYCTGGQRRCTGSFMMLHAHQPNIWRVPFGAGHFDTAGADAITEIGCGGAARAHEQAIVEIAGWRRDSSVKARDTVVHLNRHLHAKQRLERWSLGFENGGDAATMPLLIECRLGGHDQLSLRVFGQCRPMGMLYADAIDALIRHLIGEALAIKRDTAAQVSGFAGRECVDFDEVT